MNLTEAADKFLNEFPDRKIIGYCEVQDGIVFRTRSDKPLSDKDSPCLFVVTDAGKVYATNPFRSKIGKC